MTESRCIRRVMSDYVKKEGPKAPRLDNLVAWLALCEVDDPFASLGYWILYATADDRATTGERRLARALALNLALTTLRNLEKLKRA